MTTFVLILTIFWSNGPAVTSVAGFESDAACQAAGQQWAKSVGKGAPSFVCVGQKKAY